MTIDIRLSPRQFGGHAVTDWKRFSHKEDLAYFLSLIIEGRVQDGIPYVIVPEQTYSWVLDQGNDWRLNFLDEDHIQISYRYAGSSNTAEPALLEWLQYRLNLKDATII